MKLLRTSKEAYVLEILRFVSFDGATIMHAKSHSYYG
jgi:hypothetical protein